MLIAKLNRPQSQRVMVVSFGDSQPLKGFSQSDERNRRVEVQFLPHATEH